MILHSGGQSGGASRWRVWSCRLRSRLVYFSKMDGGEGLQKWIKNTSWEYYNRPGVAGAVLQTPLSLIKGSLKKNHCIREQSMLISKRSISIPQGSAHTSSGFFFCMVQPYLFGSRKPKNKFCGHSYLNIFIFSDLFHHQNQPSHH